MKAYPRTCISIGLAISALGLSAQICHAAAVVGHPPSGPVTAAVHESANVLWDMTRIAELHSLSLGVEKLNASASFAVDFSQDGAGKLKGAGTTSLTVDSEVFAGTIDNATYKVAGTVTGKGGVTRLSYNATVTGVTTINGKRVQLLGTRTLTATLNTLTGTVSGKYIDKLSAAGFGSGTETQALESASLGNLAGELGDGSWTLSMSLMNDGKTTGNSKLTGQATLGLGSGREFSFTVKGVYTPKPGKSTLTLSPSVASKGSSLKVVLVGDQATVQSIQGNVSGQTVKYTH